MLSFTFKNFVSKPMNTMEATENNGLGRVNLKVNKGHCDVHLSHQSGPELPPSCQQRETPNISMSFFSTGGISSMSRSTIVSVPPIL